MSNQSSKASIRRKINRLINQQSIRYQQQIHEATDQTEQSINQ
jgi:hypothetical protein